MLGQSCGTTYKSINVNIITEFVVAFGIVCRGLVVCSAPEVGGAGWEADWEADKHRNDFSK